MNKGLQTVLREGWLKKMDPAAIVQTTQWLGKAALRRQYLRPQKSGASQAKIGTKVVRASVQHLPRP